MGWGAGKGWGALACKRCPHSLLQGMFKAVRELSEAVDRVSEVGLTLCAQLNALLELSEDKGNLQVRVAELERSREQWEAHTEAETTRSDSAFKAARAAEERARTMRRHAEALSGSEDGEGDDALRSIAELLKTDGEAGSQVEVPDVPEDVVTDAKALGRQAKFGMKSVAELIGMPDG